MNSGRFWEATPLEIAFSLLVRDQLWAGLIASLIAQFVETLPAMQETLVQSLGWEDPLEEG